MRCGFDFTWKLKKKIDLGFYIGGRRRGRENKEEEEEKVFLVVREVREEGSEKWYVKSDRKDKRNLNLDLTLGKDIRGKVEFDRLVWK